MPPARHPARLPPTLLVDLLRTSAQAYGTHAAVVFQNRTTTHAEFDRLTDRVAAGLAARGIAPGDRVGLYCINSDVFALAYFGILKVGATVVPVNLLLTPRKWPTSCTTRA